MGTIEGFIWGSAMAAGAIVFAFVMITASSQISITQSFEKEYNTCQEQLKTATTPQCAPVTCHEGSTGIIWSIFGAILWISGLWYWMYYAPKKAEASKSSQGKH